MTTQDQRPPGTPHHGTSPEEPGAEPNPIEAYRRHRNPTLEDESLERSRLSPDPARFIEEAHAEFVTPGI